MKLKSAVLLFFLVMMMTAPGLAQNPCDQVSLGWITAQAPIPPDAKIVSKSVKHGLCEVVLSMDGSLVPAYAGKDFILAGQMFSQGNSVTRTTMDSLSSVAKEERKKAEAKKVEEVEARKAFLKKNAGRLADLVSITYEARDAKDSVYVVTDPNCSHCKALLPKLKEMSEEDNISLKVIIYPLLGPESRDMAVNAICKSYDLLSYESMTPPKAVETCELAEQRIKSTMDFMHEANVSFVPMVLAKDGSWVVEGSDICEVRAYLGLKSEKGAKGSAGACSGS